MVNEAEMAVARRCIEICERHRHEWMRESDGVKPIPFAAHATVLIADEIRREFGLKEEE